MIIRDINFRKRNAAFDKRSFRQKFKTDIEISVDFAQQ